MRKYASKYDKVYKENKTLLIYDLHTNFQRPGTDLMVVSTGKRHFHELVVVVLPQKLFSWKLVWGYILSIIWT